MATTPARWSFMPAALDSFYKQDYPADWNVQLVLHHHPLYTLGRKLNEMVERTNSDFYIIWDDDDFYSTTRLARQIEPLRKGYDITGTSQVLYRDLRNGEEWQYTGDGSWLGAFAFRRELWEKINFEDKTPGVDTAWQQAWRGKAKTLDLADPALLTASIHSDNACKKCTSGSNWKRVK